MEHIRVISYEEYKADAKMMASSDKALFVCEPMNTEDVIATLKGMLPADVDWEKLSMLATEKSALGKAHDLALH